MKEDTLQASRSIIAGVGRNDSVLVYANVQLWDVHIAEALDLARYSRLAGARTALVLCTGALSTCPANAFHMEIKCQMCVKKTENISQTEKLRGISVITFSDFLALKTPLNVEAIESRSDLLQYEYENVPIGRLVASQLADDYRDYYFSLRDDEIRSRAHKACVSAVKLYEQAKKVVSDFDASKVFVWNGRRPSDGPVWYAAKSVGAEAFTYVSGGSPGRTFITAASSVQCDSVAEMEVSIGALSAKYKATMHDLGRAHFDDYRYGQWRGLGYEHYPAIDAATEATATRLRIWQESSQTRILVLTSSPVEEIHLDWTHKLFGDDPYGWIERFQRWALEFDLAVCVRWHPRQALAGPNESRRIQQVMERADPAVIHLGPAESVDAYRLAENAHVVVGTGSTVSLWAASNSKPVVTFRRSGSSLDYLERAWAVVENEVQLCDAVFAAKPSNPLPALDWIVYAANRGYEMQHIDWVNGKPQLGFGNSTSGQPVWVRFWLRLQKHIANFVPSLVKQRCAKG